MADHKMVRVRILRRYWRGGKEWSPGAVIVVPDYALPNILNTRPPFGEVISAQDSPELDQDFDATEGAIDLARAVGLDLVGFGGQGSGPGGRIYKEDVKRWAGVE